jgi:hypothetical protein
MSAAWTAATLLLIVLGLYYVVTGARTLGQSLFVLLVGVGGLAGYLYLRRLFARAAASDRASGQRDLEAGEVDETRFEIVDAIEVAEEEDEGRHFYLRLVPTVSSSRPARCGRPSATEPARAAVCRKTAR